MKLLKFLLYFAAGLFILGFGASYFARTNYQLERSIEIDAPRDTVYKQIRFAKNFEIWSPWRGLDPNQKTIISENDGEVGATYSWEGNDEVGKGKQTLLYQTPDSIHIEVQRIEPWKGTSPSTFKLVDRGDKTFVTWKFDMYIGRPWNALAMLTNVNTGVGKDYERGLGNLKKLCENLAHPKYRDFVVKETELPLRYFFGLRQMVDTATASQFFIDSLPVVMEGVLPADTSGWGHPSALFWGWGEDGKADMAVTVPLVAAQKPAPGRLVFPVGGRAAVIEYFGAPAGTSEAHLALDEYMTAKKLQAVLPAVEEYVVDYKTEKDTAKWLTRVIYFVEPKRDSSIMK
jgi:hypothetical protein